MSKMMHEASDVFGDSLVGDLIFVAAGLKDPFLVEFIQHYVALAIAHGKTLSPERQNRDYQVVGRLI